MAFSLLQRCFATRIHLKNEQPFHPWETAMREFLTIREFSETYNVSVATIYRLRERGELAVVKIGRASRIRRTDAERWAKSLPVHQ
ncbi:helix-turn-helix domain-containing protein [Thermaurantiacus sp.]